MTLQLGYSGESGGQAGQVEGGVRALEGGAGGLQEGVGPGAIAMGGHVRVGLEDSARMPDGSWASNPALVEKIVRIAREVGREIASPDEARRILSLDPANRDRILDAAPTSEFG